MIDVPGPRGSHATSQGGQQGRVPYSRGPRGKPNHISRRWHADGLGVPSPVVNGFHDAGDADAVFVEMHERPDGAEFRTVLGATAYLRCDFTMHGAPPV